MCIRDSDYAVIIPLEATLPVKTPRRVGQKNHIYLFFAVYEKRHTRMTAMTKTVLRKQFPGLCIS